MAKDYLTYNQQMKAIRAKGIACSGSADKTILCRTGYFNLFNGFRDPFVASVNPQTKTKSYLPGTSLSSIKAVYDFDESLRNLLLPCLTKVESEVRVFAAYKFDCINDPRNLSWFDAKAYNRNKKTSDIINVVSRAYSEIGRAKPGSYVEFYVNKHDSVPTWIFTKFIKFETFINFLKIADHALLDGLCNLYGVRDSAGRPSHDLLINTLYWVKKCRNCCAHSERFYNLVNSKGRLRQERYLLLLPPAYQRDRDQRFIDLLFYLKYFMAHRDYCALMDRVTDLLQGLQASIQPIAFDKVRSSLGIKSLLDLDTLKGNPNIKNYNAF